MDMKQLYLLWLVLWSAEAVQLDAQAMLNEDLQQSLPAHQYRTLLAGEQEFTLLVSNSTTVNTRGVAILVNDYGIAHMGVRSLAPLTPYLNDTGWATLVLTAPGTQFNPDPQDQTEDQKPARSEPFKPSRLMTPAQFDRHEQQLLQRMTASLPLTTDYPGFVLIIAQGTSAAWLLKLYTDGALELPDALVTLAPYWPDPERNRQISDYMGAIQTPVLDIYNQWNNEWTLISRQERQVAALKALKVHYRQREIIGQPLAINQHPYLAKEIYGWLTHMGW